MPWGFSAAPSAHPQHSPTTAFIRKVIPFIPTGVHLLQRGLLGLVLHKLIPNCWDGMQDPGMKCVGLHTRRGCSIYPTPLLLQWHGD